MNALAAYRKVERNSRVDGASPHRLIAILFEELEYCLAQLAVAPGEGIARARAASIVQALEASLDHRRGGEVATQLGRVYREVRRCIECACKENAPEWINRAQRAISPVAEAWAAIGAGR